jgi:hypothetical protein
MTHHHRSLSVSLTEELVKPLKSSVESQHRVRKAVESGVDKTGRVLAEWRSAQAKAKKQCYLTARDNEKMQDQVFTLNNANGNGNGGGGGANGQQRTPTDKETTKLEAKCKKAQESARKVPLIYHFLYDDDNIIHFKMPCIGRRRVLHMLHESRAIAHRVGGNDPTRWTLPLRLGARATHSAQGPSGQILRLSPRSRTARLPDGRTNPIRGAIPKQLSNA